MTPCVDMVFPSIDHAYEFYVTYAKNAGFSVRKGGQYVHGEILKLKHLVCSKEGFKSCKAFDSLQNGKSRNKPSQRTGCNAHIVFSSENGQNFKVSKFVEEHNHYLVSPEDMQFLPSSRNLTYQQMQVLCNMSKVNMGPVKAFNLMRTIYGGFEQVGATAADFKNFKRDLNLYIGEYDADMVVNMLQKKRDFLPDFYFEYSHDSQ